MRVDLLSDSDAYLSEDQPLIERFRRAVRSMTHGLEGRSKDGLAFDMNVSAIVWANPLRIDFRASDGRSPVDLFVGPMLPLTDAVFEGERLTPRVLQKLGAAIAHAHEHMLTYEG